jgi:hypothetical protein
MHKHTFAAVFAIMIATVGCASLVSKAIPQKGFQAEEVKRVRTVAIVAFDVLEYKPTGLAGRVSGHVTTAQTAMNVKGHDSELALELYGDAVHALAARGWKVLPLEKITSNSVYKAYF